MVYLWVYFGILSIPDRSYWKKLSARASQKAQTKQDKGWRISFEGGKRLGKGSKKIGGRHQPTFLYKLKYSSSFFY